MPTTYIFVLDRACECGLLDLAPALMRREGRRGDLPTGAASRPERRRTRGAEVVLEEGEIGGIDDLVAVEVGAVVIVGVARGGAEGVS